MQTVPATEEELARSSTHTPSPGMPVPSPTSPAATETSDAASKSSKSDENAVSLLNYSILLVRAEMNTHTWNETNLCGT